MNLLLSIPSFRLLAVLVFLGCIDSQKCFGIEPGLYSDFAPNAKPRKIISVIGEPDHSLDFHAQDEIRIPPVNPSTETVDGIEVEFIDERKHKTLYLNRKRVEKALKFKRPKNLLVVWFDRSMMMEPEKMVDALQPFFRRLSYARVVVLGHASLMGVVVLQDRTYSETKGKNK